jgi:mono/diheme cytochrome c family protein
VLVAGLAVVAAATGFAACGDSGGPPRPTDPVLSQGYDVYNARCASCHGKGGGGGLGPKLAGTVTARYPDIADQETVIRDGKGSMPKFSTSLSAEEITAVARYEREVLGQ